MRRKEIKRIMAIAVDVALSGQQITVEYSTRLDCLHVMFDGKCLSVLMDDPLNLSQDPETVIETLLAMLPEREVA